MKLFRHFLILFDIVLNIVIPVRSEFRQATFILQSKCRNRGFLPQNTAAVADVHSQMECLLSCLDDNSCLNVELLKSSHLTCYHGNVTLSEGCEPTRAESKPTFILSKEIGSLSPCQHGGTLLEANKVTCACQGGYIGNTCQRLAADCAEMGEFSYYGGQEGLFKIHSPTAPYPFLVTCTFVVHEPPTSTPSIYMYIQRHFSSGISFDHTWKDYRDGFTYDSLNFWLGNKYLHYLTSAFSSYRLVIEFIGKEWTTVKRKAYLGFKVMNEAKRFTMTFEQTLGNVDAGDSLLFVNGSDFTAKDKGTVNIDGINCTVLRGCGFWFTDNTFSCGHANPNGKLVQTDNHQRVSEESEIFWTYDLGTWSPWHVQMWLER